VADVLIAVMIIVVGFAVIRGEYSYSEYVLLASVVVLISREIVTVAEV
jgi:type IV secretory pathway VirB2 component (pilin)